MRTTALDEKFCPFNLFFIFLQAVDVDFLLRKVSNTPERLKAVLEEIIAVPTGNDFIRFEIKDVAPIAI